MMLLRSETFKVDDTTEYTRFRIVSVAKFDAESKKLIIEGDSFNQYIDAKDQISKDNANQAGKYMLVQGKGEKGITYLSGVVQLKKDGVEALVNVEKSMVFTTSSPFVTLTGSEGKYLLAMLEGSKGTTIAYRRNIASDYAAVGTPNSASKEIAYAGVSISTKMMLLPRPTFSVAKIRPKRQPHLTRLMARLLILLTAGRLSPAI